MPLESHTLLTACVLVLDSNVQPKFYCVLSPEASEDDRSRLDSKVKPNAMASLCTK